MSMEERKAFTSKMEAMQEDLRIIGENRKKIRSLNNAIECLKEEYCHISPPIQPNLKAVYDSKLKDLTENYDLLHHPHRPEFGFGIFAALLFVTVPFGGTFATYAVRWAELQLEEKIVATVFGIGIGIIPVIILLCKIFGNIFYKSTMNRYYNNKDRLRQIKIFETEAEKAVKAANEKYRNDCARYEKHAAENQATDKKLESYRNQWRTLGNTIEEKNKKLSKQYDELQIPAEYRDADNLLFIKSFFLNNKEAMDAGTMTAMESLQQAYDMIREIDEEAEIKALANRQVNRERARMEAAANAKREQEAAQRRRKWEREEEERNAQRNKELDEFAYIVDNQ